MDQALRRAQGIAVVSKGLYRTQVHQACLGYPFGASHHHHFPMHAAATKATGVHGGKGL